MPVNSPYFSMNHHETPKHILVTRHVRIHILTVNHRVKKNKNKEKATKQKKPIVETPSVKVMVGHGGAQSASEVLGHVGVLSLWDSLRAKLRKTPNNCVNKRSGQ